MTQALAKDWPLVRLDAATPGAPGSEVRDVEWVYSSDTGDKIEGYAHADGKGIYLEGPIGQVADFVLWYRNLVPSELEVVFCDESYTFDLIISPDTEKVEIISVAESS